MINFDFNRYSIEELLELNGKLIEHVRLREQRESQQEMDNFDLGETVCFKARGGDIVEAKIISFNKKTITVERECGHRWRISPQLLEKVVAHEKKSDHVVAINRSGVEVTSSEKFSRNAPCPCGSGRKFKRCCIGKFKKVDLSKMNIPGIHFQ